MVKKYFYINLFISLLLMFAGCQTTQMTQVRYKKEYSKYVNDLAILNYPDSPQMAVDIRNDEMFISSLIAGPAIIPQLMMLLAKSSAKKEDTIAFNELVFDMDVGEMLTEKLNTKIQLCSYFHVVPQEKIAENKTVWKLLEKKDKDVKDYAQIGAELGIDTILETEVLSFGIKDPGVFSDPYAFIKADIKMTTAAEGMLIWREIVEARTKIGMDTEELVDTAYTDAEFLKKKMEEAVDSVSEQCIEKLGVDTQYTYLLDEDYREKTTHKINVAEKLKEINLLRYENLISNAEFDEVKRNLIDKARGRSRATTKAHTRLNASVITTPEGK